MMNHKSGTRAFIPTGVASLEGTLHVAAAAAGVVILSRGSDLGTPVASQPQAVGLSTLLPDLFSANDDSIMSCGSISIC
jgi:hypothetical protein